jgi:DNA modification methylase
MILIMENPLEINKIYQGDAFEILKTLPDNSIQCCVTSPPYWNLRDYGIDDQLGLEETPEKYVEHMIQVFKEVKRVLTLDGTLWLNIGDSYAAASKNRSKEQHDAKSTLEGRKNGGCLIQKSKITGNLKSKDLVGIPWMLAFALRNDGWYLRQDIIWSKPNPMPESVTDRCTKSHEYIFLLSKSQKYYYDADSIKQPLKDTSITRLSQNIENQNGSNRVPGKTNGNMKAVRPHGIVRDRLLDYNSKEKILRPNTKRGVFKNEHLIQGPNEKANKRSVWEVCTESFSEAHFATFPQKLIIDCIKAGSREKDIILDPFFGAGTTGIVAKKLNRNFIGIELNSEYIKIAERRLNSECYGITETKQGIKIQQQKLF